MTKHFISHLKIIDTPFSNPVIDSFMTCYRIYDKSNTMCAISGARTAFSSGASDYTLRFCSFVYICVCVCLYVCWARVAQTLVFCVDLFQI